MTSDQSTFTDDEPADDPLELAVRALKQADVPTGPSAETITAALNTLESRELNRTKPFRPMPRQKQMRILKAGSGLLLTTCLVVVVLTLRSPASAYTQVIEQARKARMISYVKTTTRTNTATSLFLWKPTVVREFVAEDGRARSEHISARGASKIVHIEDATGKTRLMLMDWSAMTRTKNSKCATVYKESGRPPRPDGGWKNSWLRSLQSLKDKPEKDLGEKQLDGKTVKGFEATHVNKTFTMWVDVATGRPVQIDYDMNLGHHVTMTEFKFDEVLNESLFSFDPPEGFEVRNGPEVPSAFGNLLLRILVGAKGSPRSSSRSNGEDSLIAALRAYTLKSDGKFPSSLTERGEWTALFSKDKTTSMPDETTTKAMASLEALTPFLAGMQASDYAYRGKGLSTQDPAAIIFWYKKPDGVYRAVHGDLSVKEIAAGDLPKE